MARIKLSEPEILAALADVFRGQVAAGETWAGRLETGECVAEVNVRILHKSTPEKRRAWMELALRKLEQDPTRAEHCPCETKRRSWGMAAECHLLPAYAVVITGYVNASDVRILFACPTHRERVGKPSERLAVLELPAVAFATARRKAEAAREEGRRIRNAVERAVALGIACPTCGAAIGADCTEIMGVSAPHAARVHLAEDGKCPDADCVLPQAHQDPDHGQDHQDYKGAWFAYGQLRGEVGHG